MNTARGVAIVRCVSIVTKLTPASAQVVLAWVNELHAGEESALAARDLESLGRG